MKCPHCDKEITGATCPHCELSNPEEARYCMRCGASLDASGHVDPDVSDMDTEDSIDFDDRVLCADGACTGIIVDGKCTECGKSLDGELDGEDEAVEEVEEAKDEVEKK